MITQSKKMLQLMGILGCGLCMASCGQQKQQGAGIPSTYVLKQIQPEDRELTTTYSASIRGRYDASIMPQVSGTIQRVMVSEGQKVKKGQSLFIIDQVPYRAALNTAVANVEAAQAALSTAELSYNSNKELFAQKVVSSFTLQTAENQYLSAKAALSQARAQEVNARNNLAYTEVKSPSDGVVGSIPMREGTLVGPSMGTPLTSVSDNSEMYVYFSMTENQLLAMCREYGSMDEAVKHMPAVRLKLNDGSEFGSEGRIESISGVIDRTTGTISVRAIFPNEGGILHSGASGCVIIPSTYKNAIVIPQTGTVQMQDKTLVYKVVDGKAVSTLVTVVPISDGREYIVTDGLAVGDEIVAEGAGLLREGTQVK